MAADRFAAAARPVGQAGLAQLSAEEIRDLLRPEVFQFLQGNDALLTEIVWAHFHMRDDAQRHAHIAGLEQAIEENLNAMQTLGNGGHDDIINALVAEYSDQQNVPQAGLQIRQQSIGPQAIR